MTPDAWKARGRMLEVPEGRIFVVDLAPERERAGKEASIPLLVLHGFPTSSWDFAEVALAVARDRRVVLFDFLGFGQSDKPSDAGYSLFEQADVALLVARSCGLDRVHLWAHDMGTSVATELLARRERGLCALALESLVLMNGSVHLDMAAPTLGQRILMSPAGGAFARVARRSVFVAQLRRVFAKPPSPETLGQMWDLLAREGGVLRLPAIIRYMEERVRFRRRWIGALERLDLPVLVAWGAKDPVARLAIAERLARDTPGAELVVWDALGHYPQVEDPACVVETVTRFLDRLEARGAKSAIVGAPS